MESFDLVVIGSGPAGEKGAAQAAYFGKRVAVIERAPDLGGAGVNTGTVPSKTLRESALYFSGLRQRGLYGIDYSLREGLTVAGFMHRKDAVVSAERAKIMSISVHPYISGVAHRVAYVERAFKEILSRPGVACWNGAKILDWYLGTQKGKA